MYRYDQAAWHGTDRFLADWGSRSTDQMRGYVVLPAEGERLAVVFFGEDNGKMVEMARYDTLDGRVIGGKPFAEGERPALSEIATRMIAARGAAIAELQKKDYRSCANAPSNTLVLPPDDAGIIPVYILTPPVENGAYPLGGHFRIDVGGDGKVRESRRFLNSCFQIQYAAGENREKDLVAAVVTHLLDPQPTEIHAFASRYVPIKLMVVTVDNKLMWTLQQGTIRLAGPIDEMGLGDD